MKGGRKGPKKKNNENRKKRRESKVEWSIGNKGKQALKSVG
jgi:hypothetical protein